MEEVEGAGSNAFTTLDKHDTQTQQSIIVDMV